MSKIHIMKTLYFLTLLMAMIVIKPGYAQTIVYDESRQKQWQAMELGKIEFTPKEYYRIMHGEPEVLNLWLGDRYAVYDHEWEWAGLHSGWTWTFNANKSKAVNVSPKRLAALAEYALTEQKYKEMMDTLNHQFQRELSRAVDCEIDRYYEAYKASFQQYERSIADMMTRYIVGSGASSAGAGDKFNILDDAISEYNFLHETVNNTHSAYMESMLKEEVYADVLERYKKLHKKMFWRVFAVEGNSKY